MNNRKYSKQKSGCWASAFSESAKTRQGPAPAPRRGLRPLDTRAYAAGGGALPLHPAPTRRAAGLCPCTPRLRGGRQGSALHPLGLSPQTPRC
ncbi:hypothetical protein D7X33_07520 [Butyricicoccus sp. 1XD8-22]|nr:hypothetical protein D7X33_07520 [Butyricicoccus sp. 1XD8-22]